MNYQNYILEKDVTGLSSNNVVIDEPHVLSIGKVIQPVYCVYFTESLVVKAINSNNESVTLVRGLDYVCTELFEKLSVKNGKELCGTILLKETVPYTEFKISYQAYGDVNNPNKLAIAAVLITGMEKQPIAWTDIKDKPLGYTSKQHLHDWLDLYGLEYIQKSIDAIADAINKAPSFSDLKLAQRVTELLDSQLVTLPVVDYDNTHLSNHLNVHGVTKTQIGLSNLSNLLLLNEYLPIANPNASYYKDFTLSPTTKYVTPNSVTKFVDDSKDVLMNKAFNDLNTSYKALIEKTIIDLLTNYNTITSFINTNQVDMNNAVDSISTARTIINNAYKSMLEYRLVNRNEEVALTAFNILENKYQKNGTVVNVPSKLSNLYLWLDLSDISKMTTSVVNGQTYINSITDKSTNAKIFTQSDITKQPKLITNQSSLNIDINEGTSAEFKQNTHLLSNTPIVIQNEFTYICLYKTKATNSVANMLSSNSTRLINKINNVNVELQSNNLNLSSSLGSVGTFKYAICVLSVSNTDALETWFAGDLSRVVGDTMGLSNIVKNGNINLEFTTLGDNLNTVNNDFELSELLIYNRQLSTVEVNSITAYLSRKWSGDQVFNVNTDFVKQGIQ